MLANFQIFQTGFGTRNSLIFCTQLRYYVNVLFAELFEEKKLAEKNHKTERKIKLDGIPFCVYNIVAF